jgi:hypothetical protein
VLDKEDEGVVEDVEEVEDVEGVVEDVEDVEGVVEDVEGVVEGVVEDVEGCFCVNVCEGPLLGGEIIKLLLETVALNPNGLVYRLELLED